MQMSAHEPANGSSRFDLSHIQDEGQDESYPRDAHFLTLTKSRKYSVRFRVLHCSLKTRLILL